MNEEFVIVAMGPNQRLFVYGPYPSLEAAQGALPRHIQRWTFPDSPIDTVKVLPMSMPLR